MPKPQKCRHPVAVTTALVLFGVALLPTLYAKQSAQQPGNSDQDKQLCMVGGTVRSAATGEPLKKARLILESADSRSDASRIAVTDDAGHFTIAGISDGRYNLSADRDGYVGKSYGEGDQGQSSQILALKAGQQITDIVFRLQRCAAISGRVTDEDGDPVQHVSVEVVQRTRTRGRVEFNSLESGETNDLGEYRVFDLAPGRYAVRATASSGRRFAGRTSIVDSSLLAAGDYVETYYPNTADESQTSWIELKAGDDIPGVDIRLVRERLYKVRGRIINTVGSGFTGNTWIALFSTRLGSQAGIQGVVDEKTGEFQVEQVPEGTYDAVASWGHLLSFFDRYSGSVSVQVAGADVDGVSIVISRGAVVRGKVTIVGTPSDFRRLTVHLISQSLRGMATFKQAEVKSDGTFQIDGVIDGVYNIGASSSCDFCYMKAASVSGVDVLDTGLTVSSASSTYELNIVYSLTHASLSGTVTDHNGSPSPGALVILLPDPPRQERSSLYEQGNTDQYGRFEFDGLVPGNYHAVAVPKLDDSVDEQDPDFLKQFGSDAVAVSFDETDKKSLQLTLSSLPKNQ